MVIWGFAQLEFFVLADKKAERFLLKRDITKNGIFRPNHIGEYLAA
jgi:hypothetical protein